MTASNFVQLIGHLGTDPKTVPTAKGKAFVKLNLAIHEKYTTEDGTAVEKTAWHVVHCNGKLMEVVKSLFKKGDRIQIFGKLDSKDWLDKHGTKHHSTYVIALEFHKLPSLRSLQQELRATPVTAASAELSSADVVDASFDEACVA